MKKIALNIISIFILILLFTNIKIQAYTNEITISDVNYNSETACWDFTIKYNNTKDKVYYTFKENVVLNEECDYIYSGNKISIPSSLIKSSYYKLKLGIYNESKRISYIIYNVNNIARNTYTDDLLKECYSIVDTSDTDYIKAKKLYTWIGENCTYEFDGLENHEYGAFYGKTSACSGFARLYKDMCNLVGIKCEYVSEEIVDYKYTSWHAWNHIELDGKLYLVDPTWSGVCFNNELNYSHFCNNNIVDYIVTEKYDLSSKNIYE